MPPDVASPDSPYTAFEHNTLRYSFSNAWDTGWTIFKTRYGVLLLCSFLCILYEFVKSLIDAALQPLTGWFEPVSFLCTFLLDGAIYAGVAASLVAVLRGRHVTSSESFVGFARYPSAIGAFIIVTLGFIVPPIIGAAVGAGAGALISLAASGNVTEDAVAIGAIIAGLLTVPVSLFIGSRVTFVMFLLVDPRLRKGDDKRPLGALESVRTSWTITRDCWGTTLGLLVTNMLFTILTAMCLVLPLIFFGLPLALAVSAAAYQQVIARAGLVTVTGDRCVTCGYSFSGITTPRCPECGTPRPPDEGADEEGPKGPQFKDQGPGSASNPAPTA